uniref:CSON003903 protein n=1 Tax=Culicoides sonorensis TaxID=179676 RepID=A0A336M527_CULSO
MISNIRLLSSLRLTSRFSRGIASEEKKIPKKYDLYEQDQSKDSKSVIQKEYEVKESWNDPEEQKAQEELEKPLTARERKISEDKKRLQWAKPVVDLKKDYHTKFAAFNSETNHSDYLSMVSQPWNFSISNIRRVIDNYVLKREAFMQQFIPERLNTCGPDLATTHFICFRGGRVKFVGKPEWATQKNLAEYPNRYDPDYIVEEVEYDDLPLHYSGVENIRDLLQCKRISLKNSPYFDDWCLDRLSGNNFPVLETLDLRGTKGITFNSMTCIYRLTGLKKLYLSRDDSVQWRLSIAMLEEMNPNLTVISEVLPPESNKGENK